MKYFVPHKDILPEAQLLLWDKLKPLSEMGFVLYGGTAIALRLGHRESIDFDFFSDKKFLKSELLNKLLFLKKAKVIQEELNTLSLLVNIKNKYIKISFFSGLKYGRIGDPALTKDNVLVVASLEDLLAHKLKVILQRIEAKDYKDIAAIIKSKIKVEVGLAGAKAMFKNTFQPSESLKAMVYFEGGDLDSLSLEEKKILIRAATHVKTLPKLNVTKSLI